MNRLDHVLAFGQRGQLNQIGVRRDLGKVLLQIGGCDLGIDEALFDLHRHIIFVMHDNRMEQALDPLEGKGHRSSRPFRHLFKHDHFTAMLMTSGRNLFRNVVDLEQRRMAFWFGYKSAYTLHAHQ
ncbi:hypothetical protein D3C75_1161400 [compost metagenome]